MIAPKLPRLFFYITVRCLDWICAPITFLAALWLSNVRRVFHVQPVSRAIFDHLGFMPIRRHYHEPVVFQRDLTKPLESIRKISGLDLNVKEQLDLIEKFTFNQELLNLPLEKTEGDSFYYHNKLFENGDAEFLFNMIRYFKPANIIEIGGGFSTLMTQYAIGKNIENDLNYKCLHTCIEPYERPWLERSGANVIRSKVELVEIELFQSLGAHDILFIDSSHVIRPQGDVLFEILELIGSLKSGVFIHVHDVFTPRDYPPKWVLRQGMLWNEQYVLEAFLAFNKTFRVMAALNYLWHNHRQELIRVCPTLNDSGDIEPSSFWIVKN